MQRNIALGITVIVLVAAAIYQGMMSERWAELPELSVFAERLEGVPAVIGDWRGTTSKELDPDVQKRAGAVGYLSRVYRGPQDEALSVFLITGRLDDISFHTPDRCYTATGFDMQGDPVHFKLNVVGEEIEFFTTTFLKPKESGGTQLLRVFWTMSAMGPWKAPTDARWTFKGHRVLYKLYVVVPVVNREMLGEHDPPVEFMRLLMPELKRSLFPAESPQKKTAPVANSNPTQPAKHDS